jgi:hypothetical protein
MIGSIVKVLQSARVSLTDEKAAQADLETILRAAFPGDQVSREHRLSPSDIPDFLINGAYVVEVKMMGAQKAAVFRQLVRYTEHDAVMAVFLVTNLAMTLPPMINGKPTYVVSLGRAWL